MAGTNAPLPIQSRLHGELQERLAHSLHELFDELDTRLFDLAERSRVSAQQHLYFDALRELRRTRVDVETAFLDTADRAMANAGAGSDTTMPAPVRTPLQLVDKAEQEETLILENQTQRVAERLAPSLEALLARLAALEDRASPASAETSPLSPRGFSRAFRMALDKADLNVEVRLIAFGLFGHHLLGSLAGLYTRLNVLLAEAGILPDLPETRPSPPAARSFSARRAPPRRVPDTDTAPLADTPASTPARIVDGNEVRLGEVQHLLHARRQTLERLMPLSPPDENVPTRPPLPTEVIDSALGRLWTYEGEPLDFKPHLLASARELVPEGDAHLAAEHEDVVDLVGLLFSHIRHDPNLPEPLQGMLARLHVPFLRTALKDPALLQGASHPARELVDELGALAIGWCHNADPQDNLLKQIALTVEQLAAHFQDDRPIAFDDAVSDLRQHLDVQRRRAELAEQRAIETVIGRERLALARSRVATLLEQRLREREALPWVRQLLRGPWANHLALSWLRTGEASHGFREALSFVDELLWADDPRAAMQDGARLARARAELPDQLRRGLALVALHDSEIETLATRLETFLDAQARDSEPPDYLYETDPTLAQADFATQWKDAQITEEQPLPENLDTALMAHLRSLAPGTWFEFRQAQQAESERAKLCWTSPYTGQSLFVNRNGARVRETRPETLVNELQNGLARIIEGNRLLERTLRTLIEELQQHVQGDLAHAG